jgi:hypothetical protein
VKCLGLGFVKVVVLGEDVRLTNETSGRALERLSIMNDNDPDNYLPAIPAKRLASKPRIHNSVLM